MVGGAALIWEQVRKQGTNCHRCPALHIAAFISRPKDVQDCSAVPEEVVQPLFFALFLSRGSHRVCVCVCVCVSVYFFSTERRLGQLCCS